MKELDRRAFLKRGTAISAGIVVHKITSPVDRMVSAKVANATGHRTGSAIVQEKVDDICKEINDPLECAEKFEFTAFEKVHGTFIAPPLEEYVFRGIPSEIVSKREGRKDPTKDVLNGTGNIGMTRRELIMGVASSTIFAASHNITSKGLNTEVIPASQAFGGMILWYLQRKLGIFANTAAHITRNFKVFF